MLSAKNMMMRRVLYSLNRFLYCDEVYSFPFSFSNVMRLMIIVKRPMRNRNR